MLRSLACTSAVLFLAACGDSSSSSPAPPPASSFGGTVGGKPFVPADASALVLSEATCAFGGTSASATGVAIGFGSFTGLCTFLTQHQGCAEKANATIVNLLVVRANVVGGKAGPVQPGTYNVSASTPVPDPTGNVTVAQAFVSRTDSSCAGPASAPTATKGTIRIDAVGAAIVGFADLTFDDGSHVAGTFSVSACGFQTDVCAALAGFGCATVTCVP
jgi:hypothetical protein